MAVDAQENDSRWLFYAGDAYFRHDEFVGERCICTSGLRAYQRLIQLDVDAGVANPHCVRMLSIDIPTPSASCALNDLIEFNAMVGVP